MVGTVDRVHLPDHEARIDVDRPRRTRVENDIGGNAFLVAVERETDELALAVERRRARVTTGDVEVAEEVDREVTAERGVRILAELLRLDRVELRLRRVERLLAGVLGEDLR